MQTSKTQHLLPVLIAEDDPVSRTLLEKILRKAEYEVTSVENGRKALEMIGKKYFPIVIIEWMMPEMNGLDLCRAIRKSPSQDYVFIVLLTARDSKEDIINGLEVGVDDYLPKLFHPAELVARLNTGKRFLELETSLKDSNEKFLNQVDLLNTLIDTVPSPGLL